MEFDLRLQSFEDSMRTYTGDDPLDPWDRFVKYLERESTGTDGMSLVLDRLVARFLHDERYANDSRYVNYCIRCASYYAEPIEFYSCVHSKGIGTRTAALYLAWAQQFEQRNLNEQADAVYQRAIENKAQPVDAVLQEHRMFQMRTSRCPTEGLPGFRNPLQNSQMVNQMSSRREPVMQNKVSADCPSLQPADRTVRIISKSENAPVKPSGQGASLQTESMYWKEHLICEGSEYCFEEVRATRYFQKLKQEKELRELEVRRKKAEEQEEDIRRMKQLLEEFDNNLKENADVPSAMQQGSEAAAANLNPGFVQPLNRPSTRPSSGLSLTSVQGFQHETKAPVPQVQQNHSRISVSNVTTERFCFPSGLSEVTIPSSQSARPQLHAAQSSFMPASHTQPKPQQEYPTHEESISAAQRPSNALGLNRDGLYQSPTELFNQSVNHPASGFHQHSAKDRDDPVNETAESEGKLDSSRGTANLSHVTPNTSLGLAHATPSRVLPSPTVNTREALDAIMGMFQAPTLLDDPFHPTSMLQAEQSFEVGHQRTGLASSAVPFTIFQDETDKENGSGASAVVEKAKPVRPLAEVLASKAERPHVASPELMPDESTMWGARHNSLAACPNSTRDFAMSAHLVSTPFARKGPFFFDHDQESECPTAFGDTEENHFVLQSKKLSPIMELSPADDQQCDTAVRTKSAAEQGTIVGEGLFAQRSVAASSMTEVHPPAVLSFRDQTLVHSESVAPNSPSKTSGPSWNVYRSPDQPQKSVCPPSQQPDLSVRPKCQAFTLKNSFHQTVPMSPECPPRVRTEVGCEPDLDSYSVQQMQQNMDVPMSPDPKFCSDVPMSPMQRPQFDVMDVPMSPDRSLRMNTDVPMSPAPAAIVQLVSDPWDDDLIVRLLSELASPITSHPNCVTWQCKVPNIAAKMTIRMGESSLQLDRILGEGAFATVYQATNQRTSEKMFLKLQKPANPWEFYINSQLNIRLRPGVRHLFSYIHSAHIFQDGSVLLGELHNCGTLLNAVNLYKNLSDKVMPQPLVMYFTMCILRMVEELHSIHIIHADIKPDNFLLGERFLENMSFDPENVNHGLALIDFGQSIDMELFPEDTAFTAKCMTSGFQCTEMLSGRPWNYQTDYFGIAGTVYCMLFGTYMQVKNEGGIWKTNAVFRRNPHSDLWLEIFHTLLNVPDCKSLPCLATLHNKLRTVLQENYSSKLPSLKNRLVVQLLENRPARR